MNAQTAGFVPNERESTRVAYQASHWIDPATVLRIKNLEMRAKVIVEGFFSGLHRSPFHGFSVEFSEYRAYTPGDDPRYIDWKLYGRRDRYHIKRFEEETNLRCYLLVDRSRSMGYASLGHNKDDYARTLAATLAYFLIKQRDAVGLLTFDQQIDQYLPARYRRGHLRRMLVALEKDVGGQTTDLITPIQQIARLARKRGLVVLISDLLAEISSLENSLAMLRSHGHEVLVLRVLDPAELELSISQPARIRDLETGRQLDIDPSLARPSYLQRFQQHADQVESICRQLGVDLSLFTTDQPLETVLHRYIRSRQQLGNVATRRSSLGWGGNG